MVRPLGHGSLLGGVRVAIVASGLLGRRVSWWAGGTSGHRVEIHPAKGAPVLI